MAIFLKIKKDRRPRGRIQLVRSYEKGWVAATATSRVYKHLDQKSEAEVITWLVNNGFIYTKYYK